MVRLIPKINQHADGFKSAGTQEMRYTHNSINSNTTQLNSNSENTFFNHTDTSKDVNMTADQALLFTPIDGTLVYITTTNSTFTVIGYYKYDSSTNSWIKL